MIAFLPTTTDWCKIELPHMTLVYAGTTDTLKPPQFNELAKDAASIAALTGPFYLRNLGVAAFGDGPDQVNVFRLQPTTELWSMRRFVERWNASEHPFNPHVTIGPITPFVENSPQAIGFDRIMVGWGDDSLTFFLNQRRTY
jgi:2'-5' RNA ligase